MLYNSWIKLNIYINIYININANQIQCLNFIRFKLFIKYNSLYNSFITLSKYLIFFDQLVSNFVSFEIFINPDMNLVYYSNLFAIFDILDLINRYSFINSKIHKFKFKGSFRTISIWTIAEQRRKRGIWNGFGHRQVIRTYLFPSTDRIFFDELHRTNFTWKNYRRATSKRTRIKLFANSFSFARIKK